MIHAESSDSIGWLTDKLESAGMTARQLSCQFPADGGRAGSDAPGHQLGEIVGVPVLIVHVSGREAIEQIRWARDKGLSIFGETCPQYLFLTEDDLAKPGFEGAKCLCSPPPRDKDNQEVIWQGLRNGVFQVFSSDHAPTRYNDPKGKMIRAPVLGSATCPTAFPASRRGCRCCFPAVSWKSASISATSLR